MLSYFSSIKLLLKSFDFYGAITSLDNTYHINLSHEQIKDLQQGNSPKKFTLRIQQWSQLNLSINRLVFLLETLGWLRAWLAVYLLPFGFTLFINFWPKDKSRTPLSSVINFLDKYSGLLGVCFAVVGYGGLFALGYYTMAFTAGITLTIGLLDQHNLLPLKLHHFIKKHLQPIILALTFFTGTSFERIAAFTTLMLEYTRFLLPVVIFTCKILGIQKEFVTSLEEKRRHIKKFEFHSTAHEFKHNLQQLSQRECEITHAHVREDTNLFPAHYDEELDQLLELFDSVQDWQPHQIILNRYKQSDWRTKNLPPSSLPQDIALLRSNIATFIQRLKTNNLHPLKVGSEDIIKHYIQAIIHDLKHLPRNNPEFIDQLISLGFETGNYCPIGLLKTVETIYRRRFSQPDEQIPLKQYVQMILQTQREAFFQDIYLREKLHDIYWENYCFFLPDHTKTVFGKPTRLWENHPNDLHAYTAAIAAWAPGLGIPSLAHEYNMQRDQPANAFWEDIFSATSPVERKFWSTLTIDNLKQQVRHAFNTPMLPISAVDRWYKQFIDTQVNGTKKRKAALKRSRPYTIEYNGDVPVYRLKEDVLHLMLLDFGIIHLKANEQVVENAFRPAPRRPTPPPVIPAAAKPARNLHWAFAALGGFVGKRPTAQNNLQPNLPAERHRLAS